MAKKKEAAYLDGEVLNGGCGGLQSQACRVKRNLCQGANQSANWTNKAEQNSIFEISYYTAFDILVETFSKFPYKEQKVIQNLLIGLAINKL